MALSKAQITTAINDYGPMGQIVNAVPDLQKILSDALSQQMSPAAFQAAVQASKWYQSHGEAVRNLIMTQASDPATYNETLNQAKSLVQQTANQMGRKVDVNSMAYQYLANGWTQQTLQDSLGKDTVNSSGGALYGDAAQLSDHLKEVAESYGVPYTSQFLSGQLNAIQTGQNTLDGFTDQMRVKAKATYPQFASQIDAGQTLTQIADPYMAQMAKTLEVPQSQVTLHDPYIQKALTQRDPQSGAVTSQPLWAFNQVLKADPRYDRTEQAKTDAYSTLAKVGADFGFNGSSTGGATG